jgi:predicted secreted protein
MGAFTSVAMFLTIWWTVLFAVLPWGTVTHAEFGIVWLVVWSGVIKLPSLPSGY